MDARRWRARRRCPRHRGGRRRRGQVGADVHDALHTDGARRHGQRLRLDRAAGRWQWLSVHWSPHGAPRRTIEVGLLSACRSSAQHPDPQDLMRGKSVALVTATTRPGSRPRPLRRAGVDRRARPTGRGGARSRRWRWAARAGQDRHDAQRLERVSHHTVDLRAGLGLPRLHRLQQGVRFADEAPGRIEGAAGGRVPPASAVAVAFAATAASRALSARGAGATPPHFLPTTVATRDRRLPRLLARSPLYRVHPRLDATRIYMTCQVPRENRKIIGTEIGTGRRGTRGYWTALSVRSTLENTCFSGHGLTGRDSVGCAFPAFKTGALTTRPPI